MLLLLLLVVLLLDWMLLARPLHRVLSRSRIAAAVRTNCTSLPATHQRLPQPGTASTPLHTTRFSGTSVGLANCFTAAQNFRGLVRFIARSSSQGQPGEAGDSIAAVKRQVGSSQPDSCCMLPWSKPQLCTAGHSDCIHTLQDNNIACIALGMWQSPTI